MRLIVTLTLAFGLFSQIVMAQEKTTLFSYGDEEVLTEEFIRVFLKNNKKEEQNDSSILAYLDLYVNFKLKVKEARQEKMEQNPAFIQELAGYREQLSRSYMSDTSLTSQLMEEAYERMKTEINAAHILILVGPNALPKDTLKAFNRLNELRKKAVAGANFDTLAFNFSEDVSAKTNFGDLGYFSSFDMIYPFENQAYKTQKGAISQIFRTEFGYHILKVKDKRAFRGEVKVAHLMLKLPANPGEEDIRIAKRKADSIYAQLIAGADWGTMVRSFSEDPSSNGNAGELNWLRTNSAISAPFREAAFNLSTLGAYSQPVMTEYGFHIIRLLDQRGLPPKEELNDRLRMQVNREPERVKMSQEALVTKFKSENGFTDFPANLKKIYDAGDSSFLKGTFKLDSLKFTQANLFKIGSRTITSHQFLRYIEQYQTAQTDISIKLAIESYYKAFVEKEVLQYQKDNLEDKHPDFRYLMSEYHDGILLFNLTQERVWDKAVQDTIGLLAFYEKHKSEYRWNDRLQASIYECNNSNTHKLTKKLLKKGISDIEISRQVNENNPLSLVIKRSKFQRGDHIAVDAVKWKAGTYTHKGDDGKLYIVKVSEFLPAGPKGFNEVKGIMTGRYQDELERNWIIELRSKYPVHINEDALNNLLK